MKRKLIPAITLFLGIVGATLRLVLFSSLDDRGLLPAGSPAEYLLNILSVGLLIGLTVFTLLSKEQDFRILLPVPVQAVGCLAMAIAYLVAILTSAETVWIFSLCRILGIICFLILAIYRFASKKPPLLVFVGISLSMMLLCFGQYRSWAQNTQIHSYLFPALASLFTALYSLDFAYMETQERHCRRSFFLNQTALFCNLVCIFSGDWFFHVTAILWLFSGLFTAPYAMRLPADVKKIMDKLEKKGYTAYAVGGAVRDTLLGLKPHDYDLCTSARPEEICDVFSRFKLIRNGEKHGTIGVVMGEDVYEITTYRTESGYADNRHPDKVDFVDTIQADLARRDFTINAMAYNPKTGYLDPYGGQKDLMQYTLRTVGDPETRFQEDALRILRGVRFACRFRLSVAPDTMKAMKKLADSQTNLARERVYSELTQILLSVQKDDLKRFAPILLQVIPELKDTVDFEQHSIHHAYDVFTHTQRVVEAIDAHPALRWAGLLHDIGKPACFQKDEQGQGHFHGHAKLSAQMAEEILTRLKAPTALREQVAFLILHHMDDIPQDKKALLKKVSKYGYENLQMLIALEMADENGKGKKKTDLSHYEKLLKTLNALEKQGVCLQVSDLAINGHDMMALGLEEGPAIGQCQKWLLDRVLNGEIPNEKDVLTQKVKEYLGQE